MATRNSLATLLKVVSVGSVETPEKKKNWLNKFRENVETISIDHS